MKAPQRLIGFTIALLLIGGEAPARTVETRSGTVSVTTVVGGLEHPWALDFLPDGRMLVTERPGRMRIVSQGRLSLPLNGIPEVFAHGQGGLLDVRHSPDFAETNQIYFCYAEPGEGNAASTAVARGRLTDSAVEDTEVIFRQVPKVDGANHFGCRLAFAPDGTLFVTLGERFKFTPAQDLGSLLGKVVRINPDGTTPSDNPFVGRDDTRPEIWTYGHRNVQGIAFQPHTGTLWIDEFGPRGGDELNILKPGLNYGWPLVSWGRHYSGETIPDPTTRPDLEPPVYHWTPVISPSGMSFYTGDLFPGWRDNLLMGGLSSRAIVRVAIDGNRVTDEERIRMNARIRDVRGGPDGAIYAVTDEEDGELLRLEPARPR